MGHHRNSTCWRTSAALQLHKLCSTPSAFLARDAQIAGTREWHHLCRSIINQRSNQHFHKRCPKAGEWRPDNRWYWTPLSLSLHSPMMNAFKGRTKACWLTTQNKNKNKKTVANANDKLMKTEREFLGPGLPKRPYFQHVIQAPGPFSLPFPFSSSSFFSLL